MEIVKNRIETLDNFFAKEKIVIQHRGKTLSKVSIDRLVRSPKIELVSGRPVALVIPANRQSITSTGQFRRFATLAH